MNILNIILPVFLICSRSVDAQNNRCRHPTGVDGECMYIHDCKTLPHYGWQSEITLMEYSKYCGMDGDALFVCCPDLSNCVTPEGKPGKCKSTYGCPQMKALLKPPVSIDKLEYYHKSKCGPKYYGNSWVCCGPVPEFREVKRGNCASTVSAYPPDPLTGCCGNDGSVGDKIAGGKPTTIDLYPWLVLIEYNKDGVVKTLCGGALISGKYVLTAAHCVVGEVLSLGTPTSIRLGEHDTSTEGPDCMLIEGNATDCTEGNIRIAIERTIPHPDYSPQSALQRHDIALIRMREMAPYTAFIRPICLPTKDVTLNNAALNFNVAGWGADTARQLSRSVKFHVEVPFVSQTQCQSANSATSQNVTLWKGQLCAGGEEAGVPCTGDTGGPLMYENIRMFEAVGVASFGPKQCDVENIPGVYTKVYEYDSWIRSNIAP